MRRLLSALAVLVAVTACAAPPPAGTGVGYTDTPRLPDGWRVHDPERPAPPAVDTTRDTSDLMRAPPPGAQVLFDGSGLQAWAGEDGGPARWALVDDAMEANGTGSLHTRDGFGDCELHLEWRTPPVVMGESQARGNSGVFLMGRYEVQVLDSFGNVTYADGQAASLYGQRPPRVNASRPPGAWQSYDIVFHAPRREGEQLMAPARVTVRHNGVLVHDDVEFLGATAHRALPEYAPHPDEAPLMLQDHGDPVRYRNIWVRRLAAD
jgi:hypothetical protein